MTKDELKLLKVGTKLTRVLTLPVAFKDGKWTYKTERFEVRLMAISGNYAMVRTTEFRGVMPFVANVKELEL